MSSYMPSVAKKLLRCICVVFCIASILWPRAVYAEVSDKVDYPWDSLYLILTMLSVTAIAYLALRRTGMRQAVLFTLLWGLAWCVVRLGTDVYFDSQLGANLQDELSVAQEHRYTSWMYVQAALPMVIGGLLLIVRQFRRFAVKPA